MPKTAKPKTPLYLINLEGGGDTMIYVVGKATFDWINSDWPANEAAGESGFYEKIPAAVIAEWEAAGLKDELDARTKLDGVARDECYITIGSWDNDRAMHIPAGGFDSIVSAMVYIKKQKGELVDEYHGCIY
jgi:hypothetical protein